MYSPGTRRASLYEAWAAAAQARLDMLKKAVQLAADSILVLLPMSQKTHGGCAGAPGDSEEGGAAGSKQNSFPQTPNPNVPKKLMAAAQARLEMLKKAVQLAEDNPALAGTVLGVEVAKELFHHEDHSRMQLQPFLHGERCVFFLRYTESHGQQHKQENFCTTAAPDG